MGRESRRQARQPKQPEHQLYTLYDLRTELDSMGLSIVLLPVTVEGGNTGFIDYTFAELCEFFEETFEFCPEHDLRWYTTAGDYRGQLCRLLMMQSDELCPCRDSRGRKCGRKGVVECILLTPDMTEHVVLHRGEDVGKAAEKAEAIAYAHKVFSWMRDHKVNEPDLNSRDPIEREYAQWLDDMRQAKAEHEARQSQ